MRVLIVEDDPMIGEAVQVALKNAAYATDWVKDGPTALDAVNSQNYDRYFDPGLPGKDGLEVLTHPRYRNLSRYHHARDGLDDRVRGLTAARMTMCSSPSDRGTSGSYARRFAAQDGKRFLFSRHGPPRPGHARGDRDGSPRFSS
jgi:hypothetical protein